MILKYKDISDKILKATKIEVGLLLNFGERPEIKRFAYDNSRKTNIPVIIEDNRLKNPFKSANIRGKH